MTGQAKQQDPHLSPWLRRSLIVLATNICMLTAAQTLMWSEEFDSGSVPDPNIWTAETGDGSQYGIPGWGNGEKQLYSSSTNNVRVAGGNLIITALRDGDNFTSARIKTQNKLTFQYGTVEARIKTPDLANGLWPAFWTLGNLWQQGESWPTCGEIDIMEMGNSFGIANGTVNRRIGSATHTSSSGSDWDYLVLPADIDDTFVIYRMEWTPSSITTYVDDQPIWSKNISSIPEFQKPHFLLLNLAVGGGYTGISDPADITAPFPAEYVIDYIRIYDNGFTQLGGLYTNGLPVFTSDPIVASNADENSPYSDTLAGSATDPENDTLTYFKVSGPNWLKVAANGTLSGTPGLADLGLNSWTVKVFDGINNNEPDVTATLKITVNDTNDDPVFFLDSFSGPNAVENSPYSDSIYGTASDVDVGDSLTYSKLSGPDWLTLATNGALYGTPADADVGLNSWTVQVSDGNGGTDTATLNITVENVNYAPVFTVDPIIRPNTDDSLYPGTTIYTNTIAGTATDADPSDTLTYAYVSGPTWLEVQPDGFIGGFTDDAVAGLNSWIVEVSDGNGGTDTATLQIWVGSAPTTPVIRIQMSGSSLELLWPASAAGFSLYGTTNLSPPVVWSSVTNTPIIQGDDWMVTIPISDGPQFFQLEAP